MVMIMMMDENNINNMKASIPVIFFDGEREIDLGMITIEPSTTNFKSFQTLISQKIGISPHQITTYFEHPNYHNHHNRRRNPVTNKFNFSSILSEGDCFFWVVLKRSRRVRRRRAKPENFVMLRRNPDLMAGEPPEYSNYAARLRAEMERERYLMSMNLNSNANYDLSGLCYYLGENLNLNLNLNCSDDGASSSSSSSGGVGSDKVFCEVCYNAAIEGETMPFHCCRNDAVVKFFRSPVGPIARPSKHKLG